MKRFIHKLTNEELQAYPITDLIKDWFFRVKEISQGMYLVEGIDVWGRTVSRTGIDPERLLDECKNDVMEILSNK
jgi:hypothetical protein